MPCNDDVRIGLFGGTFNPIHNGHIKMAETARKQFKLNYIYFIPCGIPPHRTKDLYPVKLRYEMVLQAIKGKTYFKVLDIEIKKKKPAYTIETVKELINKKYFTIRNLKSEIFFLIGADEFENLKKWKYPEKLAKIVIFLVLPRPEEKIKAPKIKGLKWHMVHTKPVNISSTEIRKNLKLKNVESVKKLIPPSVYKTLFFYFQQWL